MRRFVRRSMWVFLSAAIVGALGYSLWPRPIRVELATAAYGPLQLTVNEDGKTRVRERYVVSSPLSGELLRIEHHPGDRIEAGKTVLATIIPTNPTLLDARAVAEAEARVNAAEAATRYTQARLDRAREAMELAQHDYDRAQQLIISKTITREEYDRYEHTQRMAREDLRSAEFAHHVAQFVLELAKAALIRVRPASSTDASNFDIRSPVDGEVLRVLQESSAVVSAGTDLMEVGDPTNLEVVVDLLSTDAVKVHPGDEVILDHWGGEQPLHGRVRLVEPSGFLKVSALGVDEQRVNAIVDLVDPLEARKGLGDEFRVDARIVVWSDKHVLKIPAGALFRSTGQWAVFVVRDGRARLQKLEIGKNNGLDTEVLSGLSEHDQVILHPSDQIEDGTTIISR